MSTAEAEMMGYVEAASIAESVASLVEVREGVPSTVATADSMDDGDLVTQEIEFEDKPFAEATGEVVQRAIYGDNTAAISVLSLPDGPWRTRHLRLRSSSLREKLTRKAIWALRHVPGSLLVADHLTKAVNPRPKWSHFFAFLKVHFNNEEQNNLSEPATPVVARCSTQVETGDASPQGGDVGASRAFVKKELTKVIVACLGAVALSQLNPPKGSKEQELKDQTLKEIKEFVELKVLQLRPHAEHFPWSTSVGDKPSLKAIRAPLPGVARKGGDQLSEVLPADHRRHARAPASADLGELPQQARAPAAPGDQCAPAELLDQARALALAVLGDHHGPSGLCQSGRAFASDRGELPGPADLCQQARALAAALGEPREPVGLCRQARAPATALGGLCDHGRAGSLLHRGHRGRAVLPQRAEDVGGGSPSNLGLGAWGEDVGGGSRLHPGLRGPAALPLQAEDVGGGSNFWEEAGAGEEPGGGGIALRAGQGHRGEVPLQAEDVGGGTATFEDVGGGLRTLEEDSNGGLHPAEVQRGSADLCTVTRPAGLTNSEGPLGNGKIQEKVDSCILKGQSSHTSAGPVAAVCQELGVGLSSSMRWLVVFLSCWQPAAAQPSGDGHGAFEMLLFLAVGGYTVLVVLAAMLVQYLLRRRGLREGAAEEPLLNGVLTDEVRPVPSTPPWRRRSQSSGSAGSGLRRRGGASGSGGPGAEDWEEPPNLWEPPRLRGQADEWRDDATDYTQWDEEDWKRWEEEQAETTDRGVWAPPQEEDEGDPALGPVTFLWDDGRVEHFPASRPAQLRAATPSPADVEAPAETGALQPIPEDQQSETGSQRRRRLEQEAQDEWVAEQLEREQERAALEEKGKGVGKMKGKMKGKHKGRLVFRPGAGEQRDGLRPWTPTTATPSLPATPSPRVSPGGMSGSTGHRSSGPPASAPSSPTTSGTGRNSSIGSSQWGPAGSREVPAEAMKKPAAAPTAAASGSSGQRGGGAPHALAVEPDQPGQGEPAVLPVPAPEQSPPGQEEPAVLPAQAPEQSSPGQVGGPEVPGQASGSRPSLFGDVPPPPLFPPAQPSPSQPPAEDAAGPTYVYTTKFGAVYHKARGCGKRPMLYITGGFAHCRAHGRAANLPLGAAWRCCTECG